MLGAFKEGLGCGGFGGEGEVAYWRGFGRRGVGGGGGG